MTAYMPWIWLGVFAILVAVEAVTVELCAIWGSISAMTMACVSCTGMGVGWQVLLFLVLTLFLMLIARPIALKELRIGKTNSDAMVGQDVVVTKAVSAFQKGQVKTKNGMIWSAAVTRGEIEEGAVCTVLAIEGNTLRIERKEK